MVITKHIANFSYLLIFLIGLLPTMVCAQKTQYLHLDSLPKLKHKNFIYFDSTYRADTALLFISIGQKLSHQPLMDAASGDTEFCARDLAESSPDGIFEMDINHDGAKDYIMNHYPGGGNYSYYVSCVFMSTNGNYKLVYNNIGFFEGYYLRNDTVVLLTKNPLCCLDFWNQLAEYKAVNNELKCISKQFFLINQLFATDHPRMASLPSLHYNRREILTSEVPGFNGSRFRMIQYMPWVIEICIILYEEQPTLNLFVNRKMHMVYGR